jgi:hypothetical protein
MQIDVIYLYSKMKTKNHMTITTNDIFIEILKNSYGTMKVPEQLK